jgi:predicted nucleic acid-binding protein
MFILDTNVVSESRKIGDGRADTAVAAWVSSINVEKCSIAAVTLMELEMGILRVERRDATQGAALRRWMSLHVLPTFVDRTCPFDVKVAMECARLHVPDPRSERDSWIAATALVHGMSVVTRNVADFAETGVALINPWQWQQ